MDDLSKKTLKILSERGPMRPSRLRIRLEEETGLRIGSSDQCLRIIHLAMGGLVEQAEFPYIRVTANASAYID